MSNIFHQSVSALERVGRSRALHTIEVIGLWLKSWKPVACWFSVARRLMAQESWTEALSPNHGLLELILLSLWINNTPLELRNCIRGNPKLMRKWGIDFCRRYLGKLEIPVGRMDACRKPIAEAFEIHSDMASGLFSSSFQSLHKVWTHVVIRGCHGFFFF